MEGVRRFTYVLGLGGFTYALGLGGVIGIAGCVYPLQRSHNLSALVGVEVSGVGPQCFRSFAGV